MIRYTSAPQELLVKGLDLTSKTCFVTYTQKSPCGDVVITIEDADLTKALVGSDTLITVTTLEQDQTAQFSANDPFLSAGEAEVQVNWLDGSVRDATEVAKVEIERNLLEEVKS